MNNVATIYSFGYKMNGQDQFATTGPNAPLIIDCRTLNNPHNDPELRRMTGRDEKVQTMVANSNKAIELMTQALEYLYEHPEGTVAFGCAYGKHRSVALAELTAKAISAGGDSRPTIIHTGAAR